MKHIVYVVILTCLLVSCKKKPKKEDPISQETTTMTKKILKEAKLEATSPSFWSVVPENTAIEIIAEGHDWTEGPVWIPSENALFYTDIPRNAVYQWKEGQEASIYLQPSGFSGQNFKGSEPGANGLLLDAEGNLVLCQHGDRRVAKMNAPLNAPEAVYQTLAGTYEGKRLNSPNDAVYHSNKDLYFTDPPYGLPKIMEDEAKELSFQGVYRVDQGGKLSLLTDEFSRPNGLAFSPDERILYVSNSDPESAIWKAFDVLPDGTLGNSRLFYDATANVTHEKGLPDGLKVDNEGRIFATGPGGVWVFTPDGTVLGRIKTGQATSNCAFNTDKSILYITADSYVLRIQLKK